MAARAVSVPVPVPGEGQPCEGSDPGRHTQEVLGTSAEVSDPRVCFPLWGTARAGGVPLEDPPFLAG